MKPLVLTTLIFLILISSCTVYKEYPIEIYKPGEIAVPPDVTNVAIVYRNFKYKSDKFQHYYKKDGQLVKVKNDPAGLDSILANTTLKELAFTLKSKKTFERINIFPEIFKPHKGDKLSPLKFSFVKKITDASETDLLISLETFSYYYSEFSDGNGKPESKEVITAAMWAVYDPVTEKIIDRKTMIDTVFWNRYDDNGNEIKNVKLPPRKAALKIASRIAGKNYAKRFLASWQTVNRIYSVPSPADFTTASEFVQKGEWDKAIEIWKRYAPNKNGRMAIHARYNLALAYEMKDDIETAEKWLDSAMQLATSYKSKEDIKRIKDYYLVLEKRKKDIDRLNQMNIE